MKLVRLEPQPDFPHTDISGANADVLELLLLDQLTLTAVHPRAAHLDPIYKFGHNLLDRVSRLTLDDGARQDAFSHGVQTFEVISTLVRPAIQTELGVAGLHLIELQQGLMDQFGGAVGEATEQFIDTMTRTSQVVYESGSRFFPGYQNYVIGGAAIARQFELDAKAEQSRVQ